ncbi:MAG TPA: hypothetical protein DEF51_47815 [Myxococcales bacterium]|nr:hypothetical protein [Myxococcales bacterium]
MSRFLLVFVLSLSGAPLSVTAQSTEAGQDLSEARRHFDEGVVLYEQANYTLALEAFERAYELLEGHPNRSLMHFNLARCYDELERYEEAIASYRRFLAETPDDASNREEARTRVEELERRAAVRAAREPSGASESTRSEGSIANWLIAGGLFAVSVPALALPIWTLATEGECVQADELGCIERVQFGAIDGVGLGLGAAALLGSIIFAAAQPFSVDVVITQDQAHVRLHGVF